MLPVAIAEVAPTEGVHAQVYDGDPGTADVSTPATDHGPPTHVYDSTTENAVDH